MVLEEVISREDALLSGDDELEALLGEREAQLYLAQVTVTSTGAAVKAPVARSLVAART
jgi:hypothetical protein